MSRSAWSVSGVVLAGGSSRRMGQDKALLQAEGLPLWRSRCGVLQSWGASPVAIVRRTDQPALGADIPHLRDRSTGAGPLAGLEAGLRACRTRWLAVLAVDMPNVDEAWFAWLRVFCRRGVGAVARHSDGYEPLAAIYPRETLPEVERRLRRGERSLQDLVAALVAQGRLKSVMLPLSSRSRVANLNRPEDTARWRFTVAPKAANALGGI